MHMLHRQSPQIKIDVVEIGRLTNQQKILDGELDAALISTNAPVSAAFGGYLLARTRICLYVTADHPFAEREQIPLREVCSTAGHAYRGIFFDHKYTQNLCAE